MTDSRPILIIRFPKEAELEEIYFLDKSLKGNEQLRNEYHTIILRERTRTGEVQFECYNNPVDDIEIEKLTQDLKSTLEDFNNFRRLD